LGERLVCIQEVESSILFGSTLTEVVENKRLRAIKRKAFQRGKISKVPSFVPNPLILT
jgi:hypothetical protein